MNTADRNYRETLDSSARAYLQRHEAKFLGAEQQLFNLGVAFLMNSHNADKAMAENTVARAFGELSRVDGRRFLDMSASTGSTAVIVDPVSGISHAVPVALICQLLLDNPERQRLRAAS